MRVALFANGTAGAAVAERLVGAGDEVCGLVTHPVGRARALGQILGAFGDRRPPVLAADAARDTAVVAAALARWRPELILSVFYGYRIPASVLSRAPAGGINVHPSLLPQHRGRHTNVWTLVEQTAAGVTVHHMADTVDTGDVIARAEVPVRATDTAKSLHERLEAECVGLFARVWPAVRSGTAPRTPQHEFPEPPCTHRAADLAGLDEIDLDGWYTGRQLLNLLRARTFPPHPPAWFRAGRRRVYVRVELDDGGELDEPGTDTTDAQTTGTKENEEIV